MHQAHWCHNMPCFSSVATYNFSESRINVQISHALSNVTIIYHVFVHLSFPQGEERLFCDFTRP